MNNNKKNTDWKNNEQNLQICAKKYKWENIGKYNRLFYSCCFLKIYLDLKQNRNTVSYGSKYMHRKS